MTTTVKVSAHCSDDKEVQVVVSDRVSGIVNAELILQNGQTTDRVVYDYLVISVLERKKA